MKYENQVIAICLFIIVILWTGECRADEPLKLHLNLLPASKHHGDTSATNERHEGVGVSITMNNGVSYGVMHYVNSYGDAGFMTSVSFQFYEECTVCLGWGVGYAPTYTKSGHEPILGWVSLKYGWVTVLSAPGEVTAVMLSVPLN